MTDDLLIQRLSALPYTGAVSDILDELGFSRQTLPASIRAQCGGSTVAGRALTLLGEPTESVDPEVIFVPFLTMLGSIEPGDVLVSQANDLQAAHLGELSAETARFRGARGAVIDGGVRDARYIDDLAFPVFASYRTPADIAGRWRLVDWRVPITIGAVLINPGDFVLGDADGVVIIPRSMAEDVVTRAEAVVVTENDVRRAILAGTDPVEAFHTYGRF